MAQRTEKPGSRAVIDESLKRAYQVTLEQEVPDRFKELLEQLRRKEAEK